MLNLRILMGKRLKLVVVLKILFWVGISVLLLLKFLLATKLTDNIEFLRTYKFVNPDSYDWIANGMRLFESNEITFRNPGLVFIIKILSSLNLLCLLPFINEVVWGGILYIVFKITRNLVKNSIFPYVIVLIMFLNYSLQGFSHYILADYYAIFFVAISAFHFLKGNSAMAFLFLGFSCLFQNFGYFLLPVWFIFTYCCDENILKLRNLSKVRQFTKYLKKNIFRLMYYLVLFLNLNLLWFAYKFIIFGNPLHTKILQFELLTLNFNSTLFYSVNFYTVFGIPFFIFLWFVIFKFRDYKRNLKVIFVLASYMVTFVFWCLVYEWNDRRFLLYLIPFFYPVFGLILDKYFIQLPIKYFTMFLLLAVYSTTISLGWFFNAYTLALTNWDRIVFTRYSEDRGELCHFDIKFPVCYEHDQYSIKSIIVAVSPSFIQLVKNRDYYKESYETRFSEYERILNSKSMRKDSSLCEINDSIFFYEIEAISLILDKDMLSEDSEIYHCGIGYSE